MMINLLNDVSILFVELSLQAGKFGL